MTIGDDWAGALRLRAALPPLRPRVPLLGGEGPAVIGSLEEPLAQRMAAAGLPLAPHGEGWAVHSPLDAGLAAIARWLDAQGLGSRWRDELLDVTDAGGRVVGAVERAAVRPLGIATHAVHLVGLTTDGRVWVQQRSLDKATDPGQWDTLMGGLVAAGESVHDTLRRETWEEAGLQLPDLPGLAPHGRITVRRPLDGAGYMVEHIDTFSAQVPGGLLPANQDGEVERFECIVIDTLVQRLRDDGFTLEAALVLLRVLPGLHG